MSKTEDVLLADNIDILKRLLFKIKKLEQYAIKNVDVKLAAAAHTTIIGISGIIEIMSKQ